MNKKIDIFADGKYIYSTNRFATQKAALAHVENIRDTKGICMVAGRGIVDVDDTVKFSACFGK